MEQHDNTSTIPNEAERIIGEPECEHITDASRSTRWRMMRENKFPHKIRISPNRTGWRLSEVLAWLAEREAA
jgi:prophage regulatory protein